MRLLAPVLALLCVGLAAGCADDGGGGTTGEAPTRSAYIAAGDAVCRKANAGIAETNARIAQINRTATDPQQALTDAAPLLARTAKDQRASVAEFRALDRPTGEDAAIDEIVAAIGSQVTLVEEVADAAAAGDVERIQALGTRLRSTRDRVRGLLQGYGFTECGRADASG